MESTLTTLRMGKTRSEADTGLPSCLSELVLHDELISCPCGEEKSLRRSEDSSRGFPSASWEADDSDEIDCCVGGLSLDSTRFWLSAGISTVGVGFGALEGPSASLPSSPDNIFSNHQFASPVDSQVRRPVRGEDTALNEADTVLPDLKFYGESRAKYIKT